MKILQIIPAPVGSYIVQGPFDPDEPECTVFIDPCAFLALVEHSCGQREVIPCDYEDLDPEIIGNRLSSYLLCPDHSSAVAEQRLRIQRQTLKNQGYDKGTN